MNYRHVFHAGNFADVVKHALLARVLTYLTHKPAPLRYIDTHAGIGRYDLADPDALRTGEWRSGIGCPALRLAPSPVAELLRPYFDTVGPVGLDDCPLSYPGSPMLAQALLRPGDRLTLCELHPMDCDRLRVAVGRDRRAKVLQVDGYAGLNAFVPPPERRGLVLLDPPFEDRAEFAKLGAAVTAAHRKWPTGTYMLWYPLKDIGAAEGLGRALVEAGVRDVLQLHLHVDQRGDAPGPLAGSGLLLVNPPFTLKAEADIILPFLAEALGRSGPGRWSSRQLAGD